MMNDRLRNCLVALLSVAALGACDDPPVDVSADEAERLQTNPSSVAVDAGDTTFVDAFLVSALNQPLRGDVTFESCNNAIATVVEDADKTDLEPGTRFGIVGQSIGETCVIVSSGGFEDTVLVRVVAAGFLVADAPDTVRAGTAGDLNVSAVDAQGNPVGPFTETDATYTSNQPTRLFFTDSTGGYDTRIAGNANATIEWTTLGVTRTLIVPIVVIPSIPDTAFLATTAGTTTTTFGAIGAGDTAIRIISVRDSINNVNRLPQDMISITASSDNNAVATASATIAPDPARPGDVIPTIRVAAVGPGATTIDIVLVTVGGTYTFNNVPVTVLAPTITAVTPATGRPGQVVVISGTGFQQAGFTTTVFMEGVNITMFVDAITPTAITLDIPGHPVDGAKDIQVVVGGVASPSATWTQTSFSDVNSPGNETPATAPVVTFPLDIVGTFRNANDEDWYRFTIAASTNFSFRLDWDVPAKDLDLLFYNSTATALRCSTAGASAARPEVATCTLAAGTYLIYVNDYSNSHDGDTSPVSYELRGTIVP